MRCPSALIAGALAAISAVGCGDVDGGSQPFAGTILYEDSGGAFEFRLLEPPWIPPLYVTQLMATFSVVPPANATITTDPTVLLAESLYSLQVWPVTGDPATAMASVKGTIPAGAASVPMNAVETASGNTGVEMAWQEATEVFHRDAFLAGSATPTFRLHFTAQKPIDDDAMVGQMISSFRAK
jgi:hypothetical protein